MFRQPENLYNHSSRHMATQFHRIGLFTRPNTPDIAPVIHEVIAFLLEKKLEIYLDKQCVDDDLVSEIDKKNCVVSDNIGQFCDLILVLGGDGTFLSAARKAVPFRVPLIGVNQGHLGFLTQVARKDIVKELTAVLSGQYLAD